MRQLLARLIKPLIHHLGNHQNDLYIASGGSGHRWIRCSYCKVNFSPHMKVWFDDENTKLFYDTLVQTQGA